MADIAINIHPCGLKFYATVTLNEYTSYGPLRTTRKAAQRWAKARAKTIDNQRENWIAHMQRAP